MQDPPGRRRIVRPARPGPPARVLLRRGALRRCPRCGERRVFQGWFRFASHCPSCGLHFQDEEGFFLGAYLVNLTMVFGLVLADLVAIIALYSADAHADPWPLAIAGLVGAVVVPVVFYPFACTTWVALLLVGGREPVERRVVHTGGGDADHEDRSRPGVASPES